MQLMAPTPMNALRQARSASPSSELRTPGAAAINPGLFFRGGRDPIIDVIHVGTRGPILSIFAGIVYRCRIKVNAESRRERLVPSGRNQVGSRAMAGEQMRSLAELMSNRGQS